jgi:hypothetical protein
MSATAIAINVTVAVLLVFAALLTLGLCRAAGRPYPAKETRGQRVWDFDAEDWVDLPAGALPGPGQRTVRQLDDMSGLDLLYLSRPFDPATDPQWAAGRARLLNEERNRHQGDQ